MIIIAGAGVYSLSATWIVQTKREAAVSAAETFTLTLSSQLDLLNKMLDKIANSPEVLSALSNADPASLTATANELENYFPDALKITLVPLAFNTVNAETTPTMSFADLNMVRQTFDKNQLPEIHGDENATNLAITRQVKQNKQVIGVILVSMNYEFIAKSLRIAAVQNGYIELKQEKRLLVSAGDKRLLDKGDVVQTKVANGNWELYYYHDARPDFSQLAIIVTIIAFPLLITLVLFLIIQRRLSSLLKRDLDSVLQACKDILKKKPQGSYPVVLKEMSGVIFDLLQFKRILDHNKSDKVVLNNNDDFEVFNENDFFNDHDITL
jgi:phosphomannomutase/phosphoglucomutase